MIFNSCRLKWSGYYISIVLVLAIVSTSAEASNESRVPQRIVSLGPGNTKKLYLLGAGEKIIANTTYCSYPEAARHKEKIGNVGMKR